MLPDPLKSSRCFSNLDSYRKPLSSTTCNRALFASCSLHMEDFKGSLAASLSPIQQDLKNVQKNQNDLRVDVQKNQNDLTLIKNGGGFVAAVLTLVIACWVYSQNPSRTCVLLSFWRGVACLAMCEWVVNRLANSKTQQETQQPSNTPKLVEQQNES